MKLVIDELKKLFEAQDYEHDTSSLEIIVDRLIDNIMMDIKSYNKEDDIIIFEYLQNVCQTYNLKHQIAYMHWIIGKYLLHGEHSNAIISIEYLNQAISMFEQQSDITKVFKIKLDLGLAYLLTSELENAIDILESISINPENVEQLTPKEMFLLYYRLGICYIDSTKWFQARKTFEKSLLFADEFIDMGNALKNIGLAYKKQKQYDKALEYYDFALHCFKGTDYHNISVVLNNKAMLLLEQGYYPEAHEMIEKAMQYHDGESSNHFKYNYFHTYTLVQMGLGRPEAALNILLEMTENTSRKIKYNKNILWGIETLLQYAIAKKSDFMIQRIEDVIAELLKVPGNGEEYISQLKAFLGEIYLFNKKRSEEKNEESFICTDLSGAAV